MRPIDADALATDFLNDYDNYVMEGLRGNFHDTIRITDVIERIKDSPTLDYKPVKHGRWIVDYAEGSKIYHAHCSECEKEPTRHIGGDYYIDKLSDFCPNCGAEMGCEEHEQTQR